MRKLFLFTFVAAAVLSCAVFSFSQEDVYRTSYACSDVEGNLRWKAETEISASPDDGPGINVMTEKGEGSYTGYKGRVFWTAKLWFRDQGGSVSPIRMEKEVFAAGGEKVLGETQRFDLENGKAFYDSEGLPGKKPRHAEFSMSGDVVNRLILGMYVRNMLEAGKTTQTVHMLSSEPRLYKVTIRVVGRESIEVGGRVREAFKLCLDPELGLLSFVKVILPEAYVWHSAGPKFEWLRYKGIEENLESPKVEINTLD